jgi:alkanesulfonate monooxygenase SsuD/methylene tetrahydromethanopterin reductase-like flavin-dependent oxidoreductase (luciferase family)
VELSVVILPERSWSEAAARWQRAEELGFRRAWTYDHLTWRSFRDAPWFAALPTLTAAALATRRLRVGTLVASPNFRHPVPFAKELLTLDDLSGGRVTAGLGAGTSSWDASMLGQARWSPRERADRFEEFVVLLDQLLREPAVSFAGTYYSATEARTHPGCVQRPRLPFAIAATGPRGMRLAARLGESWVTTGVPDAKQPMDPARGAALVAEQMERLDRACHEVGRRPSSLRRLVVTGPGLDPALDSVEGFRAMVERYAAVGIDELAVHWPRREPPFAADPDVFEEAVSGFGTSPDP